jgi:tetratricopeptide (TPR) repeat protein
MGTVAFILAAAPMFLSGLGCAASSANAQQPAGTIMELDGSRLAVSPQEMRALSELGNLVRSGQRGAQDRALAEARRVSYGRDARYALALYEVEIGTQRDDDTMRARALDVLIANPLTRRDRLPGYLGIRGQIAYRMGDFAAAGEFWGRLTELTPSDPDVFANLAQARLAQGDAPGAMDLLMRAIAARGAAHQLVPEGWYRQRLAIAQQGHLVSPGIDAARALVSAYPSSANWRAALSVYRQLAVPEGAMEIDFLRLMRHVGALAQAAEYQRMAQLLGRLGEPIEAKAVLDEGIARGLLNAGTSPTREIIAEMDRAVANPRSASTQRSAPTNRAGAQVRLGLSRLLAGRRAEAEAAFRAAEEDPAGGGYADIAYFWLTSLAQDSALR